MAVETEKCRLVVPSDTKAWVTDCPSYTKLPPSDEEWDDIGCLESLSQTTNRTTKKVKCVGRKGTQAVIVTDEECTVAFGLKCLDPSNLALAAGGGDWKINPQNSEQAIFYPAKKNPPEKSLFIEFQNAECIILDDGTEFQPTFGFYYPRVSVDSRLDYDFGSPGDNNELIIPVTITVLDPSADDALNPDACPKLIFSDDPEALELAA